MILVDTSVWIALFRKGEKKTLENLIDFDEATTCPPIVQEVLQGFRDEFAFRRARAGMLALPIVDSPVGMDVYEEAAQIYRTARRAGVTIRSGVDTLIAASAIRHDLTVLHADRDFEALARVTALRARNIHR